MLSRESILKYTDTSWCGNEVIYKDVTESTNNDAADLARKGAASGTLVVADRQIKGRGSRGRSWETPPGANIAMSLIVRPTAPPDRISMLTLVMGLSVAEGIDLACDGPRALIKWPNDVVIDGRKVCGILTELHMNPDNTISDVVIGVGINANMTEFPQEIREVAGSLLTQKGRRVDRSLVTARCMERFEDNYLKFQKSYDLSELRQQYEDRLINRGRQVMVLDNPPYEGKALGITDRGALLVETRAADEPSEGRELFCIKEIAAGEVSVRGLYGYV